MSRGALNGRAGRGEAADGARDEPADGARDEPADGARRNDVRFACFCRANCTADGAPRKAASLLVALLVLLASALALPAASAAHGGLLLGSAEAGPYRVQLMALAVTRGGLDGPAIDYTAYVQRVDDGRPVEDADVRIVVERDGNDQTLPVQRIGNGYEGIARVPSSSDVQAYPVRVAVRGPEGTADLRVVPPDGGGGPPAALIGATVVALLLMGGLVVLRARRRPHDDPS